MRKLHRVLVYYTGRGATAAHGWHTGAQFLKIMRSLERQRGMPRRGASIDEWVDWSGAMKFILVRV